MLSFRQFLIEQSNQTSSQYRPDGTKKGPGWLGGFKNSRGDDVSEYSIGVPTDELYGMKLPKGSILYKADTLIPTLVPTLTDEERDSVIKATVTGDKLSDAVFAKAFYHAQQRIQQGKSPFTSGTEKYNDGIDAAEHSSDGSPP
jgi:hypothetical protein